MRPLHHVLVGRPLAVVAGDELVKLVGVVRAGQLVAGRFTRRVDADCRTAGQALPSVDDPAQLDALVAEFDGQGPTDEDVVGAE